MIEAFKERHDCTVDVGAYNSLLAMLLIAEEGRLDVDVLENYAEACVDQYFRVQSLTDAVEQKGW